MEILTSVSTALEDGSTNKALGIIDYKIKALDALSKAILSPSVPNEDEGDTLVD